MLGERDRSCFIAEVAFGCISVLHTPSESRLHHYSLPSPLPCTQVEPHQHFLLSLLLFAALSLFCSSSLCSVTCVVSVLSTPTPRSPAAGPPKLSLNLNEKCLTHGWETRLTSGPSARRRRRMST